MINDSNVKLLIEILENEIKQAGESMEKYQHNPNLHGYFEGLAVQACSTIRLINTLNALGE